MSFILDALKKSESERQQQNTPGIASIPQRSDDKTPSKWIWLALSLLVINIVVVAGIFLWPDPKVTETVSVDVEPASETATFSDMVSEAKRTQPEVVEVDASPTTTVSVAPPVSTASNSGSSGGSVTDAYETFNDLRAKGELALPDMHLDIHVFAGTTADRFVFVNMAKYKENAVLNEGPRVLEITPEGVVLEYQNKTFLLPRQ